MLLPLYKLYQEMLHHKGRLQAAHTGCTFVCLFGHVCMFASTNTYESYEHLRDCQRTTSQYTKWQNEFSNYQRKFRTKKCTPLWREAHLQVKMLKNIDGLGTNFGKIACRCGAKRISKSKCTNNAMFGPLVEDEMQNCCTPLWRKAHFPVR